MNTFPEHLVQRPGVTLALDPTRLLLAFKSSPTRELIAATASDLDLVLEESTEKTAGPTQPEVVNHTSSRLWMRTQTGKAVAEDVVNRAQEVFKEDIEWIGPVYRVENEEGRKAFVCPLPSVLIIKPRHTDPDSVKKLNDVLSHLGLKEVTEKSKYLGEFRYFVLSEPLKALAYDIQSQLLDGEQDLIQDVRFENMPLIRPTAATPNDPMFAQQWNLTQIQAGAVGTTGWDISSGNTVVVCVLDEGCDLTHPDLRFSTPGINLGSMLPDGSPTGRHGTACAGIAAATINNVEGVAGVAGCCQIMPLALDTWSDSEVASGINFAAANGAHVISMSFGTNTWDQDLIDPAIQNAFDAGLVMCVATHNYNGPITYPATNLLVMACGASDEIDNRKTPSSPDGERWGSNFGSEISVVAPGVHIPTTDRQGADGYNNSSGTAGNYFMTFNGTSAATPHVAGLAALIHSANPALTNQQVRDIIESTCDKVNPDTYAYANVLDHPNGTWHEEMGYGRINTSRALTAAVGRNHAVATAPNGDFVVVWEDDTDRNGFYQIMARGFNADGTEHFRDITVNSEGGGQHLKPAVAIAPDGRFVVVWEDDKDQNGFYQIMARGFNADGTERFHDITVNSEGGGQQLKPAVAMAQDGSFVVVWEDDKDQNGFYQIMARGFNADGTERFHDITVNSEGGGQQLKPAIAIAPDGRFVVVWEDDKDQNGFYQIMARGFNADGTERFHDITVNSEGGGQQLKPAVAMAQDGSFVVVWEDDKDQNGFYQIMARGFNADGMERFHDITVNSTAAGQQLRPAVVKAINGNFVVAWQDDSNQNGFGEIKARGFNPDGTERFHDITVNDDGRGQQLKPAIGMAADGNFIVGWQDDRNEDGFYQVYLRGFDANGTERIREMRAPTAILVKVRGQRFIGWGGSSQFLAEVIGTENKEVEWSLAVTVGAGTIDQQGRYAAPVRDCQNTAIAISKADPSKSGRHRFRVINLIL